ncbi:MAG TPA: class I SAM-dependent methyltransferase [Candidatus Polarisedimenticolia bacterium]|nr:class I SAM-dependent methyltransferase [Candidatus Polarisedimenticolia bacterium]
MTPKPDPAGPRRGAETVARLHYYEEHGKSVRREIRPADAERARVIRGAIPPGVETILDVGCGTGLVTRTLVPDYRVVGFDYSKDVLRGAAWPVVSGDAARLPFRDGAFDLTLSTQVIEHLTDDELAGLARELERTSRRYVLLTTTYRENLEGACVRCPACGKVFNAYGHLRSFDERSLAAVLPGARVRRASTFLPDRVVPRFVVALNHRVLEAWPYDCAVVCIACGNEKFPDRRRGLAHLSRLPNLLVRLLPLPPRPTRILMLFEKERPVSSPRD